MNNQQYKQQLLNDAKQLGKDLIVLVDTFPKKRASWVISDQLLRSGLSIGANIAEGQNAVSHKDFVLFLSHSLKSATETDYWLEMSEFLMPKKTVEIKRVRSNSLSLIKRLVSSLKKLRSK